MKKNLILFFLAIFPLTTFFAGWYLWEDKFQGSKLDDLMFFNLCFLIPIIYSVLILFLLS